MEASFKRAIGIMADRSLFLLQILHYGVIMVHPHLDASFFDKIPQDLVFFGLLVFFVYFQL